MRTVFAMSLCLASYVAWATPPDPDLARMRKNLPEVLCAPDSYFLTCYNWKVEACAARVRTLIRTCTKSTPGKLPSVTKMGACVGQHLEKSPGVVAVANARCKDPSAWR